MIKNIVFDMGKVLFNYDSRKGCEPFVTNPDDQTLILDRLFSSFEWLMLDMGVISEAQALVQIKQRLPEHLHEAAGQCLAHWHEYCMWPIAGMEELVKELKEKGYGIYLCSNASLRMPAIQDNYPVFRYFDGILFSAQVKCIKPQKEIYEHLFSRFRLKPEECFFIDDIQLNIDGAKDCGMDGYCFADMNVERLRQVLLKLEVR